MFVFGTGGVKIGKGGARGVVRAAFLCKSDAGWLRVHFPCSGKSINT